MTPVARTLVIKPVPAVVTYLFKSISERRAWIGIYFRDRVTESKILVTLSNNLFNITGVIIFEENLN